MAYSILSRQADDETVQADGIVTTPTATAAELYFRRSASEYWTGLSVGYRLSERTGLGATLFGTYRSHSQRAQLHTQSLPGAALPAA